MSEQYEILKTLLANNQENDNTDSLLEMLSDDKVIKAIVKQLKEYILIYQHTKNSKSAIVCIKLLGVVAWMNKNND